MQEGKSVDRVLRSGLAGDASETINHSGGGEVKKYYSLHIYLSYH